MRSKGSRFTLGVWGLSVRSLDVAFVVATVRNRPQPFARSPYGRAYGKFSRRDACWRFQTSRCFVSRGRRGTSWHSDVFRNVSKVVCVAGAILLRCFQKMGCSFRGRRSTLDVPIVILRGRRSTLDVSCCVFFANRIGSAASSGDKARIPWQACSLWDALKIDGSLTRNIDFEVANLEVPKKTRRKTSILWLQSVKIDQNWRKSRTKCSFCCSHVSRLESLVFLWHRCVYGGSWKTSPFRRFPSRLSCRFA